MPRRFLKKVLPNRHTLSDRWFMRPFGSMLKDPLYWSPTRRGVKRALGLGLFICFIPLPVHLLLAPLAAIFFRANIPVTIVTTFLVNPLTALPTFFTAYWVGCRLMGEKLVPFHAAGSMGMEWFEAHFMGIWKPLLLGCTVLGLTVAVSGYLLLSLVWRLRVGYRYQSRPWKLRRKGSVFNRETGRNSDQDSTFQG